MKSALKLLVQQFLEDTHKLLKDNLVEEYLFGSFARNEETESSDIDLLVIVKHFDYELRKQLSRLSSEYSIQYGVCISPILKDVETWEKNKHYQTLLYREIQRDGIRLPIEN